MATSSSPQNNSHHLLLLTLIAVMISIFSMLGISYIRFLNSAKNKTPQNYEDCCNQKELNQGYECLQGCGAPVARENDPTPPFSCLNPTQAYSRKTFGCPICLASNTYISTPQGSVKVIDLKIGMPVWSVDHKGDKIAVPVLRLSKTRTPQNHRVNHLVLSDGRSLDVSPNHPDVSGKPISLLQPGDLYDKSVVLENTLLPYWDLFTYDLLPDSETGFYFANNISMASTINIGGK